MQEERTGGQQVDGKLRVSDGQHICMLYQDDDEQYRTVAGFFAAGHEQHHKLLWITDTYSIEDVRRRFAELDVDLSETLGGEVKTAVQAYLPEGRFEPEAMLDSLDAFAKSAVAAGFAGCRCAGEMGWAARKPPGSERLIEYETLLTDVIERNPFSGICQYDTRVFDSGTIHAVLKVHPYLLVRGQVLQNPNFVRSYAAVSAPLRADADAG